MIKIQFEDITSQEKIENFNSMSIDEVKETKWKPWSFCNQCGYKHAQDKCKRKSENRVQCYNCKEYGHIARRCKKEKKKIYEIDEKAR